MKWPRGPRLHWPCVGGDLIIEAAHLGSAGSEARRNKGRILFFSTERSAGVAPLSRRRDADAGVEREARRRQAANCAAPADLARLDHPLTRMAQRVAGGQPVKIVAIGSSSTAGAGASSPAMSYPSRLAAELKALFPQHRHHRSQSRRQRRRIANEMLARFERDVIDEKPDLVLWQVGTNAVLRDHADRATASVDPRGSARGCATPAPTWC